MAYPMKAKVMSPTSASPMITSNRIATPVTQPVTQLPQGALLSARGVQDGSTRAPVYSTPQSARVLSSSTPRAVNVSASASAPVSPQSTGITSLSVAVPSIAPSVTTSAVPTGVQTFTASQGAKVLPAVQDTSVPKGADTYSLAQLFKDHEIPNELLTIINGEPWFLTTVTHFANFFETKEAVKTEFLQKTQTSFKDRGDVLANLRQAWRTADALVEQKLNPNKDATAMPPKLKDAVVDVKSTEPAATEVKSKTEASSKLATYLSKVPESGETSASGTEKAKPLGKVLQQAISELSKMSAQEIDMLAENDSDKEAFKMLALASQKKSSKGNSADQGAPSPSRNRRASFCLNSLATPDLKHREYDLAVVGGGPAGVAAALVSAKFGCRTLIVDKPKMPSLADGRKDPYFGAPTGLFSKALRDVAKTVNVNAMKGQSLFHSVIWEQIKGMCLDLATMNSEQQMTRLDQMGVCYLQAAATITAPGQITAQCYDDSIRLLGAKQILLATGSKASAAKGIPFDDYRVFDSDTVNGLSFLPQSVVIVGSGIISFEYAKIFCKLAAHVTLLVHSSLSKSLMKKDIDIDLIDSLITSLRNDNVKIYEYTTVAEYHVPINKDEPIRLALKSSNAGIPDEVTCDIFLAAIGRKANSGGMGLKELGVNINPKDDSIIVDDNNETNIKGIFAAGDCIGPPQLASTSIYQAKCAVIKMLGKWSDKFKKPLHFPVGMWTTPECAYYGLTKQAANAEGLHVTEGIAKYTNCLRGRVFAPEGLLKLVFRTGSGRIVGVHILGADACEMVHYGMDLVDQKVTIFKVISTLFTAVTFHELFKEAALDGNSKLSFQPEWNDIFDELCMDAPAAQRDESGNQVWGFGQDQNQSPEEENALIEPRMLRAEFDAANSDRSGSIDAVQLGQVFTKLGKTAQVSTMQKIITLVAGDGAQTIKFEDFLKIFEIIKMSGKQEDLWGFSRQIS